MKEESGIKNTQKELLKTTKEIYQKENVLNVKNNINQTLKNKSSAVGNAGQELVQEEDVYDLMVDEDHEFFANNVLVHNCIDAMAYLLTMIKPASERKNLSVSPFCAAGSMARRRFIDGEGSYWGNDKITRYR
jgi:hypothetical protein